MAHDANSTNRSLDTNCLKATTLTAGKERQHPPSISAAVIWMRAILPIVWHCRPQEGKGACPADPIAGVPGAICRHRRVTIDRSWAMAEVRRWNASRASAAMLTDVPGETNEFEQQLAARRDHRQFWLAISRENNYGASRARKQWLQAFQDHRRKTGATATSGRTTYWRSATHGESHSTTTAPWTLMIVANDKYYATRVKMLLQTLCDALKMRGKRLAVTNSKHAQH